MSREISCTVCKDSMGVIRDANLRKDIKYLCGRCDTRRLEALVELYRLKNKPKNPFENLFDFKKGGGW